MVNSVKPRRTMVTYLRWSLLAAILAFMFYGSYMHIIASAPGYGTVDSLCPFGGVETFYKWIASGSYIGKLSASALILMAATLLIAFVARRAFCAWLCPLGVVQEWAGALGRKVLGKRRFLVPAALDRWLRYLKYVALGAIVYFTWLTGELVWRSYDPWATLMHAIGDSTEFWGTFLVGAIVLGVSIVGSFFYDRFFCKYACPLGAVLAVAGKVGLVGVRREESACTHCHICNSVCPMNVNVEAASFVKDAECISCLQCVESCPRKGALSVGTIWDNADSKAPRRSLNVYLPAVLAAAIFFGSYGLSVAAGVWSTTGGRLVVTDTGAGDTALPASYPSVDEIKGSNSLQEVMLVYRISATDLLKACKLPETLDPATKIKDVKTAVGLDSFEPVTVRDAVTAILKARAAK